MNTLFNDVPYTIYSDHEEKETLVLSRVGLGKQAVGTIVTVKHDDGSVFVGRVGRQRGLDAYGSTVGKTNKAKYKNAITRNVVSVQFERGTE